MTLAPPKPTTGAAVLRVTDAARAFGATRALAGVSLELRPGELLALLGPNGAGKTTLIRGIAGRVRFDGGTVELMGHTLDGANGREALGVVPQEVALYPLLTARENLEAFGNLQGVTRAELSERVKWALDWTGLADRAKDLVKTFSGGMKRRLNIAAGVLHRPRVVLLDEPTVGVDPQSRERIYEMLAALRAEGASLLLTTHQLEEAEARCDRVVILDHGRVIESGTVAELVERSLGRRRAARLSLAAPLAAAPDGFTALDSRTLRAEITDLGAELPQVIARAQQAGATIEDVAIERRGLHEVFLQLTGKDLRE
jgi:ABC-2 type transport system ATP-binding protein